MLNSHQFNRVLFLFVINQKQTSIISCCPILTLSIRLKVANYVSGFCRALFSQVCAHEKPKTKFKRARAPPSTYKQWELAD